MMRTKKTWIVLLAALLVIQPTFAASSAPAHGAKKKSSTTKSTMAKKTRSRTSKTAANQSGMAASSQAVAPPTVLSTPPPFTPAQLRDLSPSIGMRSKLARMGGRIERTYSSFGLISVELPLSRIRELGAESDIAYLSPDRSVISFGHGEATTGADQVRGLVSNTTLNGSGITIAVLDSGVDANHNLFKKSTGGSKVVFTKDFTGDNLIGDTDGHGTFVASLAAGVRSFASGAYSGVAPGANVINLRVLDDDAAGSASNIVAALDWCIAYKDVYNIRVINMSLGVVAVDSYKFDPLCLAARRAHEAGIVVVAAAGNDGKDHFGRALYGAIHSPGSDPSVITVGATNSKGTDSHLDDVVATYSSRGPTRGFFTDAQGVRHFDNLIKPDHRRAGQQTDRGSISQSEGCGVEQ